MAINDVELRWFQENYREVTGQRSPGFYCPILNEFRAVDELMNGHVLPEAIKSAARATVIQVGAVDSHFGEIEDDLSNFLNLPVYEIAELFGRAKNITLRGAGGVTAETFPASPKSSPPFPAFSLKDEQGRTIIERYARILASRIDEFDGPVDVEGEINVSMGALLGAMIKSAHLALFKMLGYRWALSRAGQFVGSSVLAPFVRDKADRQDAARYFMRFNGCLNLISGCGPTEDTLSSKMLVLHFDPFDGPGNPFERGMEALGVSCVFRTNDAAFLVTLPFSLRSDGFEGCLDRYMDLIGSRSLLHKAYQAYILPDRFECTLPFNIRFLDGDNPTRRQVEG